MFVSLTPSQVIEDAGDETGFGDCADDLQFVAAARTPSKVDIEDPFEPGHPAHRHARHAGRVVTGSAASAHGGSGHDEMSVSGVASRLISANRLAM
jgi:hypothetical protein